MAERTPFAPFPKIRTMTFILNNGNRAIEVVMRKLKIFKCALMRPCGRPPQTQCLAPRGTPNLIFLLCSWSTSLAIKLTNSQSLCKRACRTSSSKTHILSLLLILITQPLSTAKEACKVINIVLQVWPKAYRVYYSEYI